MKQAWGIVNTGAVFQRVLRGVEDDKVIFEQSLRAEARGQVGGWYNDPGEG